MQKRDRIDFLYWPAIIVIIVVATMLTCPPAQSEECPTLVGKTIGVDSRPKEFKVPFYAKSVTFRPNKSKGPLQSITANLKFKSFHEARSNIVVQYGNPQVESYNKAQWFFPECGVVLELQRTKLTLRVLQARGEIK